MLLASFFILHLLFPLLSGNVVLFTLPFGDIKEKKINVAIKELFCNISYVLNLCFKNINKLFYYLYCTYLQYSISTGENILLDVVR